MRTSGTQRLYSVVVHDDAEKEIETLWETDEDTAAYIEAFLEEIQNDQRILDSLTIKGHVDCPTVNFDVEEILSQKKKKRNLWRIKIWEIENRDGKLRIIYAFHPKELRYYILGITPRDIDYDERSPRFAKIISSYEKLGIPEY